VIEDLNGCVAVVTGGASGIGHSTARALAAAGAAVVIADIHEDRMTSARQEITASGGQAIACRCDVASDDDVVALREAAVEAFGPVDVVMNNVGVLMLGSPENIPLAGWERTFNLNVLSVARSIHAFLPGMLERGRGHIVNTASTAGLWGYSPDRIPYASSKAAVIALSESLAIYARPRGVGVTCLCPGPVKTNIAEQIQVFGQIGPIHTPPLAVLEPDEVAVHVLEAIRNDTFLVPTHEEVFGILVERAADHEGFLAEQGRAHAEAP
jgi:NAD(P)-dependent dehydrogenase (short-subunit alcohol dehydrogenase family)